MNQIDLVMLQLFLHCKIHLKMHLNTAHFWNTDESFDRTVLIVFNLIYQCVFLDPKCPHSYICILKYCVQMLTL